MERGFWRFWADLLRQAPLAGAFMLVGTVGGCIIGLVVASNLSHLQQPRVPARLLVLIVLGISLAGGAVGLIIGVIADSIFGTFRSDKKKRGKKRRRRRHEDRDAESSEPSAGRWDTERSAPRTPRHW